MLRQELVVRRRRIGNTLDFRKTNSIPFYETEEPIKVKQWLVDTENLLGAANIVDGDHVELVKVLTNNAYTWLA